jgi:hypothetical protein
MGTIELTSVASQGDGMMRSRGLLRGCLIERRMDGLTLDVRWYRRTSQGAWVPIRAPWAP